jgi:catechol 2,3-dioxygenase-like lactoylglutathione lyase family enzyme
MSNLATKDVASFEGRTAESVATSSSMKFCAFHLAIPVYDLAAARRFYRDVLGLQEGRSSAQWVDFDFYGHQLVLHEHPETPSQRTRIRTRWMVTTYRFRTSAWCWTGIDGKPWPLI